MPDSKPATPPCPKCKGEIRPGSIISGETLLSFKQRVHAPVTWIEDSAPSDPQSQVQLDQQMRLPITAFRCWRCGFLEFYAGWKA